MNREDIIRMAKEAGIRFRRDVFHSGYCDGVHGDELEAFAALVASAEREACAKVCEGINSAEDYYGEHLELVCAEAIRARGQA